MKKYKLNPRIIERWLGKNRLTISRLAKLAEIDRSTLSRMISGKQCVGRVTRGNLIRETLTKHDILFTEVEK